MTKPALQSTDPLIMKVRKALKAVEPRMPIKNIHKNEYGFDRGECPYCGEEIRPVGYNGHFSRMHGTSFWKEKYLIEVIRG